VSAERDIPEPGELVYATPPSWGPAFFALGAALAVCGVFAEFMLAALRSMVRGARASYYRLPRRQRVRGAVLPVETITAPPRD